MNEFLFGPLWDVVKATAGGTWQARKVTGFAFVCIIISILFAVQTADISYYYIREMFPNPILSLLTVIALAFFMFITMSFIGLNICFAARPTIDETPGGLYLLMALIIGGGLAIGDSYLGSTLGAKIKAEEQNQTESYEEYLNRTNQAVPYQDQINAIDAQIAGFQGDTYQLHDGSKRVHRNSSNSASSLAAQRQELLQKQIAAIEKAENDWQDRQDNILYNRKKVQGSLAGFQWVLYLFQIFLSIPTNLYSIDYGRFGKSATTPFKVAAKNSSPSPSSEPSNFVNKFWDFFNKKAAGFSRAITAQDFAQIMGDFSAENPQIPGQILSEIWAENSGSFSAQKPVEIPAQNPPIGYSIGSGKISPKTTKNGASPKPKSSPKFGPEQGKKFGAEIGQNLGEKTAEKTGPNIHTNLNPETPYNLGIKYNLKNHEKRQLNFVRKKYLAFVRKNQGKRPMLNELADACGKNRDTVSKYVKMMQKDGQVLLRKRGERM